MNVLSIEIYIYVKTININTTLKAHFSMVFYWMTTCYMCGIFSQSSSVLGVASFGDYVVNGTVFDQT